MSKSIRAAAQELLTAVSMPQSYERVVMTQLAVAAIRDALAEPAQPAPAADAVQVVAIAGPAHDGVQALFAPGYAPTGPEDLVRQTDHLAAMEALRQELADSQSALKLLADETVYRGNSVSFIYDKAAARGKAIDDVFEVLREHGVRPDGDTHVAELVRTALDAQRQENERLKADRSAQVAEVMRRVAAYGARVQRDSLKPSVFPAECDVPDYTELEAVQAAVRKLAGEA
jgi:hypothetical protein